MHLQDCLDLDQTIFEGLWAKSEWEKELTDPKRICLGIIESESKKLLGLCSAWIVIDEVHITFIAVYPMHQRKGLGKFLLSEIIKRSKSLQTNLIYLEVKNNNEPAKALYKSMDFRPIGIRSNFYKDGSDALTLTREIKTNNKMNT